MPSGKPITPETREQILADYARGGDCRDIAARYGVARSVVTMSAHRAGISRKPRAAYSPGVLRGGRWVWTNGIARWVPYDQQQSA